MDVMLTGATTGEAQYQAVHTDLFSVQHIEAVLQDLCLFQQRVCHNRVQPASISAQSALAGLWEQGCATTHTPFAGCFSGKTDLSKPQGCVWAKIAKPLRSESVLKFGAHQHTTAGATNWTGKWNKVVNGRSFIEELDIKQASYSGGAATVGNGLFGCNAVDVGRHINNSSHSPLPTAMSDASDEEAGAAPAAEPPRCTHRGCNDIAVFAAARGAEPSACAVHRRDGYVDTRVLE
eukprot:1612-Heterococcus_DN1.PRE.2